MSITIEKILIENVKRGMRIKAFGRIYVVWEDTRPAYGHPDVFVMKVRVPYPQPKERAHEFFIITQPKGTWISFDYNRSQDETTISPAATLPKYITYHHENCIETHTISHATTFDPPIPFNEDAPTFTENAHAFMEELLEVETVKVTDLKKGDTYFDSSGTVYFVVRAPFKNYMYDTNFFSLDVQPLTGGNSEIQRNTHQSSVELKRLFNNVEKEPEKEPYGVVMAPYLRRGDLFVDGQGFEALIVSEPYAKRNRKGQRVVLFDFYYPQLETRNSVVRTMHKGEIPIHDTRLVVARDQA